MLVLIHDAFYRKVVTLLWKAKSFSNSILAFKRCDVGVFFIKQFLYALLACSYFCD